MLLYFSKEIVLCLFLKKRIVHQLSQQRPRYGYRSQAEAEHVGGEEEEGEGGQGGGGEGRGGRHGLSQERNNLF